MHIQCDCTIRTQHAATGPSAAHRTQDAASGPSSLLVKIHDVSIGPAGVKTQDASTGVGYNAGICSSKTQEKLLDGGSRSPEYIMEKKALDQLLAD